MASAFRAEKPSPGKTTLQVTVVLPCVKQSLDEDYDIPGMSRYVISKGAAKTKLILSLTTKASYFLYNMHIKFGYFRDGSMDFLDVCLSLDKMVKKYDNVGKVPYAESKGDALMYENEDSLKLKVNYAKKSGLAGVCVFSLDSDDFLGLCFDRMLPLTNAVKIECRMKLKDLVFLSVFLVPIVLSGNPEAEPAAFTLSATVYDQNAFFNFKQTLSLA
ncbi:Chitinase-3-like protein 1 [Bulinus truncatus]|nr:Chitinase-3-like protein 1 [Bulinus truncatus]